MFSLRVLTYNTLFAGRDGQKDQRFVDQIETINLLKPDVYFMQEARGFGANGAAGLFAMEKLIGMRGFLSSAPRTGQNVAIFLRSPLAPISFDVDSANFHHTCAVLRVAIPGVDRHLTLVGVHLCPNGPETRLREAAVLAIQARADQLALVAGDFNSASPHDALPTDWARLEPHHQARYASADWTRVDHAVLNRLESAGWVDVGHVLGENGEPTVPTLAYRQAEFPTMRCDYVLASKSMAVFATGYQVIRSELTDRASDHYPVLTTFEVV
ncbi:endonuclease/exonuclease/phosphatase family protein [Pandoraea sp. B-6]|uniref:endonuclease/exonuclease/phosphatase family protein n=1 Tax=Pandoraea sp. B-6 TaxID=1204340 RepID=UPI000366BFB0|nr:endonuclease/exonuclease/phosphatase family protein [Pandoraea sp. B-6]